MNEKFYNISIAFISIGLILMFIGFLSSEKYFLFDYYILWENSKLIIISGLLLFIIGMILKIIGAFLIEDIKTKSQLNTIQKQVYSGICPVCHQAFETTAEIIKGYYVFNCNKCNSKLRVKKLSFFPAG
jgi:hypothetical protein